VDPDVHVTGSSLEEDPLPLAMRIARVALWYAGILSILMILLLPLPFTFAWRESVSWFVLAAIISGATGATIMISRRRRVGWTLAVGTSLFALAAAIVASVQSASTGNPVTSETVGRIALAIEASVYIAWLLVLAGCLRERHWKEFDQ
jgi:uncharacterized membrane protein